MNALLATLVGPLAAAAMGSLGVMASDVPQIIRSGPKGCHQVAITFDVCPVRSGSGFDEDLVDELVRERIPATFFLSGRWISAHDAAVRRLLEVPFFEVETHGQLHAHLPKLDRDHQRDEIEGPADTLRARYGYSPVFFRPPYGEYDDTTLSVAHDLGLQPVLWSSASGDPDPRLSESEIVKSLSQTIHDGSVIVFHANGKGLHTRAVIEDLEVGARQRKRLRSVTLSELVNGCEGGRRN
jgi:peptidoglycan-N-acetylglucosamine deacetylase